MIKNMLLASALSLAVIVPAQAGMFDFLKPGIDQETKVVLVPQLRDNCVAEARQTGAQYSTAMHTYCVCAANFIADTMTLADWTYVLEHNNSPPADYKSRVITPAIQACLKLYRP